MDEIFVSRSVLERMKRGALLYPDMETGEALVGLRQEKRRGIPAYYLLETIPPMQNAVREWAHFSQGDDWQGAIFNWLNENWEVYRDLRRSAYGNTTLARWDLPLEHVGDWHKQPSGMTMPSTGDFRTAKDFLQDNDMDFVLTPIVTFAQEAQAAGEPVEGNTYIFTDVEPSIRIDFWGLGRRDRQFVPLKPVPSYLPLLPAVVWWLNDRQRMDLEIAALEKDGLNVMDVVQYNVDGMPPLETCFVIYRPGAKKVMLAITPYNYPRQKPQWRLAPLRIPKDGEGLFELLYKDSELLSADVVSDWSGDIHALLDAVRMIEKKVEDA
jgi:hypothetical protein